MPCAEEAGWGHGFALLQFFAEAAGGGAVGFFEGAGEVELRGEARHAGDFSDG